MSPVFMMRHYSTKLQNLKIAFNEVHLAGEKRLLEDYTPYTFFYVQPRSAKSLTGDTFEIHLQH